jgi:long-chain acyl-CoA synthetase
MDERGSFRLTDRKKDMIVVSGFKVFPNEIEDVLAAAPRRAGGRRHRRARRTCRRSGEGGGGAQGPGPDRGRLAGPLQAAPDRLQDARIVEFRTEPLPKTNIGKILRRERAPMPRHRPSASAEARAPAHAARNANCRRGHPIGRAG